MRCNVFKRSSCWLGLLLAGICQHGFAAETMTNSLGMSLTKVPAGEFMMGAEEDASITLTAFPYCRRDWLAGETPRHLVRITKPFYMGTYEVTLRQFLKFYHDAKCKLDIERDGKPSWGYSVDEGLIESTKFPPWYPIRWKIPLDHPAIYVSWNDANAFCTWLSKKEGKTYRLPTEAEWEYACRAGSHSRFAWGDDVNQATLYGNVADQDFRVMFDGAMITMFDKNKKIEETNIPFPFLPGSDGYEWTAPVGKFRPNAFGLHDMHGNVWEWCADWYADDYYANSPVEDPQGPPTGSSRVVRGGAFNLTPVSLRCAYRYVDDPATVYYFPGFRVVCVAE